MKKYESPDVEVLYFNTEDVILTSIGDTEVDGDF